MSIYLNERAKLEKYQTDVDDFIESDSECVCVGPFLKTLNWPVTVLGI